MCTRSKQAVCRLGATALVVGSMTMFPVYGQQMPTEYDSAMKTLGKQGEGDRHGALSYRRSTSLDRVMSRVPVCFRAVLPGLAGILLEQ
jgi:hypothetical protein